MVPHLSCRESTVLLVQACLLPLPKPLLASVHKMHWLISMQTSTSSFITEPQSVLGEARADPRRPKTVRHAAMDSWGQCNGVAAKLQREFCRSIPHRHWHPLGSLHSLHHPSARVCTTPWLCLRLGLHPQHDQSHISMAFRHAQHAKMFILHRKFQLSNIEQWD
jgi:hypothetical protein